MGEEKILKASINPLTPFFLDESSPAAQKYDSISDEDIWCFICDLGYPYIKDNLINRYRDISKETKPLVIAPAEENIQSKLINPLKNALACYMMGNCLGTIALCGMVAEMSAILLFEISELKINGKTLDEIMQKQLFGSTFEKLGQDKRTKILYDYNLIDNKTKQSFDDIRTIRKRYLHIYSQKTTDIEKDAKKIFHATIHIVVKIIGQDFRNGGIVLNPAFSKYLENKGIISIKDAVNEQV